MSYSVWGTSLYEIDKEMLILLAPVEVKAFYEAMNNAEFNIDNWAEYIANNEDDYEKYLDDGQDELLEHVTLVKFAYNNLIDAMTKHSINLGIFTPLAHVESGEDRAYWIVENALVQNPKIAKYINNSLTKVDVVQGG